MKDNTILYLKDEYHESLKPSEDRRLKPSEDRSVKPGEDRSVKPSEDRSVKPSEDRSVKPGEDRSVKPSEDRSVKPGEDRSLKPGEDRRTREDVRTSEAKKTRSSSFAGEKDTPVTKKGRSEPPGSSALGKPSAIPSEFDFLSSSSSQHRNQTGLSPSPSPSGPGSPRDGRKATTPQNPKEGLFVFSAHPSFALAAPVSPPTSSRSRSSWLPRPQRSPVREKPAAAVAGKTSPPLLPSEISTTCTCVCPYCRGDRVHV